MHYFNRHWEESRGDDYDSWGRSEWWFETDSEGCTIRCVQRYENGYVIFYSEDHQEDQYGVLPEVTVDIEEYEKFTISKTEFNRVVQELIPINVSKIK